MDHNDRQAIDELFGKLKEVERHVGPRDPEAEALIGEKIAAQPGAPYYMAQTIVAQEHALMAAQRRIEELEGQNRGASGGFLGAIFGGSQQSPQQSYRTVPNHEPSRIAHGGGGFLAGAAQTAVGVAGGVFLASMIAGAFAGGAAQAAEPQGYPADDGGDDGFGDGDGLDDGDGFDVGGFDFGGDF